MFLIQKKNHGKHSISLILQSAQVFVGTCPPVAARLSNYKNDKKIKQVHLN